MRPYFVGNTKARLARMTPENRRRVIEHARQDARRHADPCDIARHLFAVRPCHLTDCGYVPAKGTVSVVEHFIDYVASMGNPMTRARVRRLIKIEGTMLHEAYNHYRAGWRDHKGVSEL